MSDSFSCFCMGVCISLTSVLLVVLYSDNLYSDLVETKKELEEVCEKVDAKPQSYDKYTVVCDNGLQINYKQM